MIAAGWNGRGQEAHDCEARLPGISDFCLPILTEVRCLPKKDDALRITI